MAGQGKAQGGGGNILYIVAYIFTWITGIVVFLIAAPSEKRLRFNGMQAVFLGIIAFILYFIPIIGGIITLILWILGIVVGIKAYQGEDMMLPVIGGWAKHCSR